MDGELINQEGGVHVSLHLVDELELRAHPQGFQYGTMISQSLDEP